MKVSVAAMLREIMICLSVAILLQALMQLDDVK